MRKNLLAMTGRGGKKPWDREIRHGKPSHLSLDGVCPLVCDDLEGQGGPGRARGSTGSSAPPQPSTEAGV